MSRITLPKDATKREHYGRLDRPLFWDDDQPFCILKLTDGCVVAGRSPVAAFERGTLYRFMGRWKDDAVRGPRFNFDTFVVHHPGTRTGTVRYLTKLCDGIGEGYANRLYDKYAGECVSLLRDDPDKVAAECQSIPIDTIRSASQTLRLDAHLAGTKVELHELTAGRGFHGAIIDSAIETWGAKAATIIRRNPFALLGLPGAGFKRCDKLWSDLKLPEDALKRQGMCLLDLVRRDGVGHTWVHADELASQLREWIPNADPRRAVKFAARARLLAHRKDAGGKLYLAVYERAVAEKLVADRIRQLRETVCLWPTSDIPVSQREGDKLPSEHQVGQLILATAGPVGLFCGSPGTGKTHVLAYLLRAVIAEFGRSKVAVCAPTGKAAVRARQALRAAELDIETKTVHGLLKPSGGGMEEWSFLHHRGNPLPYQFIIVDESSMLDATILACLLDACADGTHVLFVGDPFQLPPVGHGAPLRDMIAAGLPYGELRHVRRNAGQIVHACVRIKNNEEFETCEKFDLAAEVPQNLRLVETTDDEHTVRAVEKILGILPAVGFHPAWQTQILVAKNKTGPLSRVTLNKRLHNLLNPDGYAESPNPFRVGDKVICLKNSKFQVVETWAPAPAQCLAKHYTPVNDQDTGKAAEVYVANGEIGRVEAVAAKLMVVRFSERDELAKIPVGKQDQEGDDDQGDEAPRGRGCQCDHAWAITTHKSQGSESPCVIVVADQSGGQVADRHWWYTAVSRASKACILVGQRGVIDKQRVRQSLVRRQTFLKELITEVRS